MEFAITNEFSPRKQHFAGRAPSYRFAAVGIAVAIHCAVLWIFASGIRPSLAARTAEELQVILVGPDIGPKAPLAPALDWQFETPVAPLIPVPDIAIIPQPGDNGIVADTIARQLGPRLDPAHINERPQLPHTLGDLVSALSLELRILVLADGSVGQAQIIRSTGTSDIDRLAIEWVQNTWRYLPATVNDKPIAAWTTVIVRFAPF